MYQRDDDFTPAMGWAFIVLMIVAFAVSAFDCRANALDVGLNLSAPDSYMSPYHAEMIPQGYWHARTFRSVIHAAKVSGATVWQDYWDVSWNTPNIGTPSGTYTGGTWENPLTGATGKIVRHWFDGIRPAFELDSADHGTTYGKPLFLYQEIPPRIEWAQGVMITEWMNMYKAQTNPEAPEAIDWRGGYTLDADVSGTVRITAPGIDETFSGVVKKTLTVEKLYTGRQAVSIQFVKGPCIVRRLSLRRAGIGGVSQAAFDALHTFQPRVLRYWQGQHGQSLDGMINGAFHAYTPRDARAMRWELPLPDFLDLCDVLGARPWIVCPTVFRDDEMVALAEMLPDNAYMEYGNESWGSNVPGQDPFAGASLAFDYPAVAQRKLSTVEPSPITTVMGGQTNFDKKFAFTNSMRAVCSVADRIAIAPYYASTTLIGRDYSTLVETPLIYEIQSHYHTSPHALNGTMIGAVAGIYHLLDARTDLACVFTAFQYETKAGVYLWGLWRDTATYQPRALAIALERLRDFQPTSRVDNLTWTDGKRTLYLAGAEPRVIPETSGEILDHTTPDVPDVRLAWTPFVDAEMPPWSMVLGERNYPKEMVIQVPMGTTRIVLELPE